MFRITLLILSLALSVLSFPYVPTCQDYKDESFCNKWCICNWNNQTGCDYYDEDKPKCYYGGDAFKIVFYVLGSLSAFCCCCMIIYCIADKCGDFSRRRDYRPINDTHCCTISYNVIDKCKTFFRRGDYEPLNLEDDI